jgi:hypothetical protein
MARLNRAVRKTNLSREGYVRRLIGGYEPQSEPPQEYWDYVRQLWAVEHGINEVISKSEELSQETREQLLILKNQLAETAGKLQSIAAPKKKS